jgi:hypothetical protein
VDRLLCNGGSHDVCGIVAAAVSWLVENVVDVQFLIEVDGREKDLVVVGCSDNDIPHFRDVAIPFRSHDFLNHSSCAKRINV